MLSFLVTCQKWERARGPRVQSTVQTRRVPGSSPVPVHAMLALSLFHDAPSTKDTKDTVSS